MKTTLVIMPGSPALIGELAPGDTLGAQLLAETRSLFTHCLSGNSHAVDLVGSRADAWYTAHTGSLRAWGAPQVQLQAGNHLPELIQRYALGAEFETRVRNVGEDLSALRAGTLTVLSLDGSTGLTPRAPSSLLEGATEIDHWCRELLAGKHTRVSEEELLRAGIREPKLWCELAALLKHVESAELILADTSQGVGRYVALWTLDLEETEEES